MDEKPKVSDAQLREMVEAISDPRLREHYERVIGGKIVREVVCESKACGGKVVAVYFADGQLVEINSENKDGSLSGCASSRQRLDGHMGFKCRCGNNSVVASQEEGIINQGPPTKQDLETIFSRVSNNPTPFNGDGTTYTVDGFTVRPYSGGAF